MHNTHHSTTSQPPRAQCQVCKKNVGKAFIGGLLVCGICFVEAKNETIRLYRASLRLIAGGWPR
jgi:hypothetical protein